MASLERRHKEALSENMRFKIGLKSNDEVRNSQPQSTRHSEVAIVHRRILSGPNPILSCKDTSDINYSNSFNQAVDFTPQLGEKTGHHVKSSTQIMIQRIENSAESSGELRMVHRSQESNDHFKKQAFSRSHIQQNL